MIWSKVDFPAPDGPMMEMNSPSFTSMSIRRRIKVRVAPVGKDFSILRSLIITILASWCFERYRTSNRNDGTLSAPAPVSCIGLAGMAQAYRQRGIPTLYGRAVPYIYKDPVVEFFSDIGTD